MISHAAPGHGGRFLYSLSSQYITFYGLFPCFFEIDALLLQNHVFLTHQAPHFREEQRVVRHRPIQAPLCLRAVVVEHDRHRADKNVCKRLCAGKFCVVFIVDADEKLALRRALCLLSSRDVPAETRDKRRGAAPDGRPKARTPKGAQYRRT